MLLVDGLFGPTMAVSPTECREAPDNGWTVVGCCGMGALRAADLWPLGIGIGDVYDLYRLGKLTSDADVAVAYDPDSYAELTLFAVHVRGVPAAAVRDGLLDPPPRSVMSRELHASAA